MRGEVIKDLINRDGCRKALLKGFNELLEGGEAPSTWKLSRTRMIKKVKKPTVKEFRPIAVTSVGYKLYWGYMREVIEEHIIKNGMERYNQVGFTKGGRLEFNHFILQFIVDRVARSQRKAHKMLIVTALDFRKAYDSIDRGKLIETLVKFRIHPAIIELVVKVYNGDETMIKMGDKETKIAITSGIKQGCTASTVFFKLITYLIIDKLEREGEIVEVGGVGLNSLWFADDSLVLSNSVEGTARNIRLVREVSRSFGLEINEDKSAILVFKGDPGVREIEGIKVVKNFKYLGLNIGDGNDIFEKHKINIIKNAAGRATGVGMVVEKRAYLQPAIASTGHRNTANHRPYSSELMARFRDTIGRVLALSRYSRLVHKRYQ